MRALITRPSEDSTAIAERLEALGIEPVIEPLMTVDPVDGADVGLDGVQAILVTSRNGVRALAQAIERRDVPVYAVGDSTADLARESGFETVESAAGDVEALAELVRARLKAADGTLLHVAGAAVAGDLAGALAESGYTVRRQELYVTRPVSALSVTTSGLLSGGEIELALFFSPRTAQTFVDLVKQAGLTGACTDMTAICLSRAVARSAAALPWREVHVADRPNLRSMIEVAASAGIAASADDEPEDSVEEDRDARTAAGAATSAATAAGASGESRQQWGAGAERAQPRRRTGRWIAAVVVIAAAAAGVYYWPLIAPRLAQQFAAKPGAPAAVADAAAEDRTELAARLTRLEESVRSLRSNDLARLQAAASEATAALPELSRRMAAAERAAAAAGSGDKAAVEALGARIEGLEQSIGDLRKVMGARIDGLDTRVSGLASGAAADASGGARLRAENDRLKTALAALTDRIAKLEEDAAQAAKAANPGRGGALMLAVAQLRQALARSGPFSEPLDALAAVAGDDPAVTSALEVLRPLAPSGVPTEDRLIATFDSAAAATARAALAPEGSGWMERTVQRLASVITIRREGAEVAGDSPQAVLARAESRLAQRDLPGAEAALAALTAEPAAAMAEWRKGAAARIAANDALDRLDRHAVQQLSGGT